VAAEERIFGDEPPVDGQQRGNGRGPEADPRAHARHFEILDDDPGPAIFAVLGRDRGALHKPGVRKGEIAAAHWVSSSARESDNSVRNLPQACLHGAVTRYNPRYSRTVSSGTKPAHRPANLGRMS